MRSSKSLLKKFNTGIVVGDMTPLSNKIRVFPMENQRAVHGDVKRETHLNNIQYSNELEDPVGLSITLSYTIEATWIALHNHNRLTAPMMRNGEKVQLYRFGDSQEILWASYDNDQDLRTTEYMIMGCSNKDDRKKSLDLKNTYYCGMDTINKTFTVFHIPDNNGEYTSYDFKVNSKDGSFIITDGKDNHITLDSATDKLTIITNKDVYVKSKTITMEADTINMKAKDINMKSTNTKMKITNWTVDSSNNSIKGTTSHNGSISTTSSVAVGSSLTTGVPISTAYTAAKT